MVCKSCGAAIADDALFCTSCGAAVAEETAVETVPAGDASVEATVETTNYTVEDAAEPVDPGKTFGLISMICGIVALVLGALGSCVCACFGGSLPFIAGVAGIVFGILGMNKSKAAGIENKQAKLGLILSIAGLAVIIIGIVVNAILGGVISAIQSASQPSYGYNYYY